MTKYQPGDRVEVKITGEVSGFHQDSHGVYYPDYLVINGGDIRLHTKTPGVQVRKLPPRKPQVGDVIDGARLRATPWRAGTVIQAEDGTVYLLTRQGRWGHQSGAVDTFDDWDDVERIRVVYLP